MTLHVDSEVGQLKQVIIHEPGLELSRLTPANVDDLLFDDVMWARMARASIEALENGTSDAAFHETKLATGRYYMARRLPATAMHLARIESGADPVMALDAEAF